MSSSDQDNRQRNLEIAANEAKREAVSNVRVSSWAIVVTVVIGVIVFGIVWVWFNR
jgi:capsule polysaccharide export protein KpsE/RkpR